MSLNNLSNPKSILAKLLAQENLTIEHRKVSTASFDPVNRVLCLPIWKDMSSDLYDLLVGHEVGHAWDTPPEGWHSAIEEKGKGFKSFLNVVEDARIERNIKNRYPGLRSPFYKAYKELFDNDFFGLTKMGLDLEDLKLIDRLNLHFKIGPFLNVPFLSEEKCFVNRMETLTSWEEVYELASELYDYHKDHDTRFNFDDIQDFDRSNYSYDDDEDGYDREYDDAMGRKGGSDCGDPFSDTDNFFREKEKDLITDSSKPFVYCNLPVLDPNKFIVTHKKLYTETNFSNIDNFSDYFIKNHNWENIDKSEDRELLENIFSPARLLLEYKNKNTKFIQYLIKEFELKRNAAQYARANVSKTGELDMEKVWSYKLREDLFKRVTKIPKGKNHGMVMFIDWSGSMTDNITNTIEQLLILADFCRKVAIPFEVYAFSDSEATYKCYFDYHNLPRTARAFILKEKDLYIDLHRFSLLNLLSSSMTSSEYRNAQIRLLQLAEIFKNFTSAEERSGIRYYIRRFQRLALPTELSLGGTPLNETIILANQIVPLYKAINKLDVVNTIFLTDGDGNEHRAIVENGKYFTMSNIAQGKSFNIIIKDKETGLMGRSLPDEPITIALLKLLKLRTNTNLVGYFISSRNIRPTVISMAQTYNQFISIEEAMKFYRHNKYYGMNNTGYDKYFIVTNKDMEVGESSLETGDDKSKNALKRAFITNQKNKFLNRILISKFVDQIA